MPVVLIPAAAFLACCVAQFYFLRRVRQALAKRHPEVWRDISMKAWFVDNSVYKFAWKRRDRELGDLELTTRRRQLIALNYLAITLWVVCCALMVTRVGLRRL